MLIKITSINDNSSKAITENLLDTELFTSLKLPLLILTMII